MPFSWSLWLAPRNRTYLTDNGTRILENRKCIHIIELKWNSISQTPIDGIRICWWQWWGNVPIILFTKFHFSVETMSSPYPCHILVISMYLGIKADKGYHTKKEKMNQLLHYCVFLRLFKFEHQSYFHCCSWIAHLSQNLVTKSFLMILHLYELWLKVACLPSYY